MQNIIIHNSTVYINNYEDIVNDARDKLLTKLYYARNKSTMGGYDAWLELLNMYYMNDYQSMKELISSCRGKGGRTRNECIYLINIIIGGNNK